MSEVVNNPQPSLSKEGRAAEPANLVPGSIELASSILSPDAVVIKQRQAIEQDRLTEALATVEALLLKNLYGTALTFATKTLREDFLPSGQLLQLYMGAVQAACLSNTPDVIGPLLESAQKLARDPALLKEPARFEFHLFHLNMMAANGVNILEQEAYLTAVLAEPIPKELFGNKDLNNLRLNQAFNLMVEYKFLEAEEQIFGVLRGAERGPDGKIIYGIHESIAATRLAQIRQLQGETPAAEIEALLHSPIRVLYAEFKEQRSMDYCLILGEATRAYFAAIPPDQQKYWLDQLKAVVKIAEESKFNEPDKFGKLNGLLLSLRYMSGEVDSLLKDVPAPDSATFATANHFVESQITIQLLALRSKLLKDLIVETGGDINFTEQHNPSLLIPVTKLDKVFAESDLAPSGYRALRSSVRSSSAQITHRNFLDICQADFERNTEAAIAGCDLMIARAPDRMAQICNLQVKLQVVELLEDRSAIEQVEKELARLQKA